jgi:hypothetical protein
MAQRRGTFSGVAGGYGILCLRKHHTTDAYKGLEAHPTAPLIPDVIKNEWSYKVFCIQTSEPVCTADIRRQFNGYLAIVQNCHHVNYEDNLSSKRTVPALCLEMY